jgi:hypothetical protein
MRPEVIFLVEDSNVRRQAVQPAHLHRADFDRMMRRRPKASHFDRRQNKVVNGTGANAPPWRPRDMTGQHGAIKQAISEMIERKYADVHAATPGLDYPAFRYHAWGGGIGAALGYIPGRRKMFPITCNENHYKMCIVNNNYHYYLCAINYF